MFKRYTVKNMLLRFSAMGAFFIAPYVFAQDAASVNDLIRGAVSERNTIKSEPMVLENLNRDPQRNTDRFDHKDQVEPFKIAKEVAKEEQNKEKLNEKVEKAMAKEIERNLLEEVSFKVTSFKDDGKKEEFNRDLEKSIKEREDKVKSLTEKVSEFKGLTAGLSRTSELEKLEKKLERQQSKNQEKATSKEEKIAAKEEKKEEKVAAKEEKKEEKKQEREDKKEDKKGE